MAWYNPFDWGKQEADPAKAKATERDFIISQVQQGIANANNRQAPQAERTVVGNVRTGQASQLDPTQANQARAQMGQLADMQMRIATGQQAGAGELAAQRQAVRAAAQQQAMAASQRGGNAALAARTAARNIADIGLGAAGQAQQAAFQDQQAAMGQLGSVLGTMRGQDLDMASQNAQLRQQMNLANLSAQNQQIFQQAGLDQATSLANMQARLQAMGLNDQAALGYLSQLLGMNQAELAARMGQEQAEMAQKGIFGDLLSAGGQLGAAAIMASDRDLKADIRDAREDVDAMMAALKPYAFRYRDEAMHGEGERVGIMAQDLEASELGGSTVVPLPDGSGLGVDVGKGLSLALAGIARLNERLAKIEARLADQSKD